MPTFRCGRSDGFTLLETLLVLVLAALLLGAAASALSEGPVLRQASRDVATSLRHARAQAVLRQQPVVWQMDIQAKRFWQEGGTAVAERTLHPAITARVNTSADLVKSKGQGGIRFYPDGSSSGGSVELALHGQTYKINVEWVTGRVTVN